MKKILPLLIVGMMFSASSFRAQCALACNNYTVNSIPFNTVATAGQATVIGGWSSADDGVSSAYSIGFDFPFYCNTYNQFLVGTNGFITLGTNNTNAACCSGGFLPGTSNPGTPTDGLIAVFWTDGDVISPGSISYEIFGAAPYRRCVITFSLVSFCCSYTGANTAQVILYETTNNIEIHTVSAGDGSHIMTQGIQNAAGTIGVPVPGRNSSAWQVSTPSAYLFSPFQAPAPTAISGASAICAGWSTSYSIAPVPGATTYSWSTPMGWTTGTNTTTALTATVPTSGNLSVTATYSAAAPFNCIVSFPTVLNVDAVAPPVVSLTYAYPTTVCSGNSVFLYASGAYNYDLEPGGMTFTGNSYTFIPTGGTTNYTLTGTNSIGCPSSNSVVQTISVNPTPQISISDATICAGQGFTMNPTGGANYIFSNGTPIVNPPTGMYSYVINSTIDGCSAIPAICNLTVYSMPNPIILVSKNNVCNGDAITLIGAGAQNYQWNTGSNPTASLNIVVPNTTGVIVYSLTGTNDGGCSKTATVSVIADPCVGIKELTQNNNTFAVYPNPNNGKFTVEMDNNSLEKSIKLFDLTGRVLMTLKTAESKIEININELSNGIYYLQVQSGADKHSLKLVKE